MSVFWLRTAAALYSGGLLYALLYLFRKSTRLFIPALIAFATGTVLHFVSIVELWAETGHMPLNNFYETSSLCAFLDSRSIPGGVQLLPCRDFRGLPVSSGVLHDPDRGY